MPKPTTKSTLSAKERILNMAAQKPVASSADLSTRATPVYNTNKPVAAESKPSQAAQAIAKNASAKSSTKSSSNTAKKSNASSGSKSSVNSDTSTTANALLRLAGALQSTRDTIDDINRGKDSGRQHRACLTPQHHAFSHSHDVPLPYIRPATAMA